MTTSRSLRPDFQWRHRTAIPKIRIPSSVGQAVVLGGLPSSRTMRRGSTTIACATPALELFGYFEDTALAGYFLARRAATIDPVTALRWE